MQYLSRHICWREPPTRRYSQSGNWLLIVAALCKPIVWDAVPLLIAFSSSHTLFLDLSLFSDSVSVFKVWGLHRNKGTGIFLRTRQRERHDCIQVSRVRCCFMLRSPDNERHLRALKWSAARQGPSVSPNWTTPPSCCCGIWVISSLIHSRALN